MRVLQQIGRFAGEQDIPAVMSRAGPHVNDPIRLADDIQVMLNHNDRAVLSDKSVDDGHKPLTVGQVKASRRFIEHINFTLLIELCRQLHPRRSPPDSVLKGWPSVK